MTTVSLRRTPVAEFFTGAGYLLQGLRLWATSPRLMLVGAIPAFVVGSVYVAGIILLATQLGTIAAFVTPFATDWTAVARDTVRVGAGLAVTAFVVLLAVFTFAAVTLAVGDPLYERIWRSVETRIGDPPGELDVPFWRSALRGLGNALRILAVTALVGILLFACSFIPVVGQPLVTVAGALFGGWFLTLELSGYAFDARGLSLRERRRMLGARRTRTLGFGVLTYVLFLVPLAAVVIMPAAVAGATLLSRDTIGTRLPAQPRR